MNLKKLMTYTFEPNVGFADRVFRIVSGFALNIAGYALDVAPWMSAMLIVAGLAWCATGVLSRCSIYYVLGYSTCPASRPANAVPSDSH